MSLYPPGVTGTEPAIAGHPERDGTEPVNECRNIGEYVTTRVTHTRARTVLCTFQGGEVEGLIVGDRHEVTFYWACPVCGSENDCDSYIDDDAETFGWDEDPEW